MLGAMTSLTGGGGLTGGAATATSGDTSFGGKSYGGVNFGGAPNKGISISPMMGVAILAVIALFLLKK